MSAVDEILSYQRSADEDLYGLLNCTEQATVSLHPFSFALDYYRSFSVYKSEEKLSGQCSYGRKTLKSNLTHSWVSTSFDFDFFFDVICNFTTKPDRLYWK